MRSHTSYPRALICCLISRMLGRPVRYETLLPRGFAPKTLLPRFR